MSGAQPKSCEHCGIATNPNRRYVPPSECRQREVHGELHWLCSDCEREGAPLLKTEPVAPSGPAPFQPGSSTSRAGASAVADKTGPQKLQVLGAVAWMGTQGATRNQVLKIAGITEKAACGRLKDLVDEGKLYVQGERLEDTGCRQQIYHVSVTAVREVAA